MLIGIALMSIWFMQDDAVSKDVSWTEFQSYVEKDGVKSIIVYSDKRMAEGVLTDSMTNVVFGANNRPLSENSTFKGVIVTDIPSNDKLEEKVDQWRADGTFTGDVKYENICRPQYKTDAAYLCTKCCFIFCGKIFVLQCVVF